MERYNNKKPILLQSRWVFYKETMKTKVRLGLTLKLYDKDGKMVSSARYKVKERLTAAAESAFQNKSISSAYINVFYGYDGKSEVFNDGVYWDIESLKGALSAFTKKATVDYLQRR